MKIKLCECTFIFIWILGKIGSALPRTRKKKDSGLTGLTHSSIMYQFLWWSQICALSADFTKLSTWLVWTTNFFKIRRPVKLGIISM